MLRLFFAPLTRSIRIKWLLEELGLEHEIIPRQFDRTAPYVGQDTPSGRYPVLYDGDTMLCESGAVVQYVLEKFANGRLQPAIGSPERAAYLYWFHYSEASAAVPSTSMSAWRSMAGKRINTAEIIARTRQSADRMLDGVEAAIEGRSFLVGDALSGARHHDGLHAVVGAHAEAARRNAIPRTLRYLGELKARPAFAKALAEGRDLKGRIEGETEAAR